MAKTITDTAANDDERALVAACLDLIGRDMATVREIVATLPADRLVTEAADVWAGLVAAVEAEPEPTRFDVKRRLVGDAAGLMVDLLQDVTATGSQAARVAREAAGLIEARHNRRMAVMAAQTVERSGGDPAAVSDLMAMLSRCQTGSTGRRTFTLIDALDQWAKSESTPVVPTGFSWLDVPTGGGLPVGGLAALVAPPGVGKSALALQWAAGALVTDPTLTAVWGLGEMTPAGLARRMVSVASGLIDGDPVTMAASGRRAASARAAAVRLVEVIGERFVIVSPLTVEGIDAAIVTSGARLAVVDYLQLIHGPDAGKDRVSDLDRIIGRFREIAVSRECAVILVSSMAKGTSSTSRAGTIGRGTSEIDYAVDLLYLGEREERNGEPVIDLDGTVAVRWLCKKSRNGEPQDLKLRFDGSTQTYRTAAAVPVDDFGDFAMGDDDE
jgi:replicative DNA helicase